MDTDSIVTWQAMQTWTVLRLDGFKINGKRSSEQFLKPRWFQLGGLVRNKLLHLTVALKQKSFLWTMVLRPCRILAIGLWDIVIDVFEAQAQGQLDATFLEETTSVKEQRCEGKNQGSRFWSPECTHFQQTCVLFIFDDNDAVIKIPEPDHETCLADSPC